MKKISALAMGVLCAVASVGFVADVNAETMRHDMDEVVVEGQKDLLPGAMMVAENRVGILGDIPVIEVPFTQRNYSQNTIENFADPNQPLNGVLSSNPSIRVGSPSPMYTDFSMRGVNMNAAHYYLNGVPNLFNQTRSIPAYTLESVDIISGPNTVLNGASFSNNGTNGTDAPAGLLNATTKKAGAEDLIRYTQKFSGHDTLTEDIDLGHRFGDGEWGVRVNAHIEDGELAIDDANVNDKSVYVNLDRKGDHATTNIFGGYFDWEIEGGQRWLRADKVTKGHLVDAIDGSTNLSFADQIKENHGYLMTINHNQKLSDSWDAFANMGYGYYTEHKFDPHTGSLNLGDDGVLTGAFRDYKSESKSLYGQMGVMNKYESDKVKNTASFAVDYFKYKSKSLNTGSINNGKDEDTDEWLGAHIGGNLWDGVEVIGKPDFNDPVYAGSLSSVGFGEENAYAMTLADRAEFGKLSVYGALQYKDTEKISSKGHKYSKDCLNPSFAVSYAPVDKVSVYTSYAESYTRPVEVSKDYLNKGDILEPIKNHQYEVGVKYENANILHSFAIFDMNQASYIKEEGSIVENGVTKKGYWYTQEGENRFKGFEYYMTGKVSEKVNLMGGFMYLNGKREKLAAGKEALEGKFTTGTPDWNATFAVEYEADAQNTALAKVNYTSSAHVNDNGVTAPAFVTFDLGFKHETHMGNTPVTLRAMCYNLFGEDYWISRGTSVALGAPRTLMLSASFDI